jgi:molybdopterin molybdotransferase
MAKPNLTPLEDALDHLLSEAPVVAQIETVALADSLGRVLAENHYVPADVPPADNSAVDGSRRRAEYSPPGAGSHPGRSCSGKRYTGTSQ